MRSSRMTRVSSLPASLISQLSAANGDSGSVPSCTSNWSKKPIWISPGLPPYVWFSKSPNCSSTAGIAMVMVTSLTIIDGAGAGAMVGCGATGGVVGAGAGAGAVVGAGAGAGAVVGAGAGAAAVGAGADSSEDAHAMATSASARTSAAASTPVLPICLM